MNTSDPKPSTMMDGYEIFVKPTPWKVMILYGLLFSSWMCGMDLLLESAGHGRLFFDPWWVNFLFFFVSGLLIKFAIWQYMKYAYRRKDG